ncbi:MAG: putative DNA binding domain-containing protein [Propionibacteriaceae bacterium]|nr:putative DNA binding domain-containing protein [Propionibacteriaceae bacterium]
MSRLQEQVNEAMSRIRAAGTDLLDVEVKKAAGGPPKSLPETVSAFANTDGGLLILGIDEKAGFIPVGVDPKPLAVALAGACHDAVEPSIRAEIDIVDVDGVTVAAAFVPALSSAHRPCYVRAQGIERGSYLRGHDGDRHLSTYEIHALFAEHGQPKDDVVPVPDATMGDFDPTLVTRLVERLRRTRGPVFATQDETTILRMVGALTPNPDADQPTLAGMLCLGFYPQQFFPQLNITFVSYPTVDGRPLADGTRFLDNQAVDGPIPLMVEIAEQVLIRNMTRRAVIDGGGREDVLEYPLPAFRELIVNAIMHRDYFALAHGSQIRIEQYPDRLDITSPGGLFGVVNAIVLTHTPITASRNATLCRLLEDIEMPNSTRTVAENRGTGLITVSSELERAGMPPAQITSTLTHFTVEMRRQVIRTTGSRRGTTPSKARGTLTRRQAEVLALLQTRPRSSVELASLLNVTRQAVIKHLNALEAAGRVAPVGSRYAKSVTWKAV